MNKNLLNQCINDIFRDVHPSWKHILKSKDIVRELVHCMNQLLIDLNNKGINHSNINELDINDFVRPNISNILEPFKYFDANNLKAVIVGQDPYPNKANATGLAFSVPKNVSTPPSLKMIYKNLMRHKLLSNNPGHGDISSWAKQGVLLINIYPTRTPLICISEDRDNIINNMPKESDKTNENILLDIDEPPTKTRVYVKGNGSGNSECLHRFWINFTKKLLKFISTKLLCITHRQNAEIHILLWGNEAQKLESSINIKPLRSNKVIVHKWGHPSPLNRKNSRKNPESFMYNDHFTHIDINYDSILYDNDVSIITNDYEMYKSQYYLSDHINEDNIWEEKWIYDDGTDTPLNMLIRNKNKKSKIFAMFTDGGCENNGSIDATGTFAVYIPEKYREVDNYAHGIICGNMEPYILEYDKNIGTISYIDEFTKITNSRTELLAMAYAMYCLNIHWNNSIDEVHIIVDSKYIMDTVDRKMYNDYNKNFDVPNGDIIRIIYHMAKSVANKIMGNKKITMRDALYNKIKLFHQRSHVAKKNEHKYDPDHIEGNKKADEICNELKKMTKVFNNDVHII